MTNEIPEAGFLRLSQIVGQKAVTAEQAIINSKLGSGPRKPRPAIHPIVPVSKSTWWAGVKDGRFPKPVKLGPRTTCWRKADVLAMTEIAGN